VALTVVKLGGSLHRDPALRDWLQMLADAGRGQVVIVPGGGGFADLVREHQAHWHFDDLAAHNMAVLAMMQSALLMKALAADLVLAAAPAAIKRALRDRRVALWLPRRWLRSEADDMTHWGATSDSLAAALAGTLGADRLVLVKSCEIQPGLDLAAQAALGVVDADFCRIAAQARIAIDLLGRTEVSRLRLLLGGDAPRPPVVAGSEGSGRRLRGRQNTGARPASRSLRARRPA